MLAPLTVHLPWPLLVIKDECKHPAQLYVHWRDACLLLELQAGAAGPDFEWLASNGLWWGGSWVAVGHASSMPCDAMHEVPGCTSVR